MLETINTAAMGDGNGGDAIHIAANSDQARIEAVTVFEDRAEVTRRVKVPTKCNITYHLLVRG